MFVADTFQGFDTGRHSSFSVSPPRPHPTHWILVTLGWSVIHFQEPLHSNYQRGVRGKVSSWDRSVHAALWSSMEYFKLRGSHFQLAWHQLHLPWLPTRQLIWHFRKYFSWRGFLSKGHCLWVRDISWYLWMSFVGGECQERCAAPPWPSSQPLFCLFFFSYLSDLNLTLFFLIIFLIV